MYVFHQKQLVFKHFHFGFGGLTLTTCKPPLDLPQHSQAVMQTHIYAGMQSCTLTDILTCHQADK